MNYFDQSTFDFLEKLQSNNNRDWFTKNKKRYQTSIDLPGKAFYASVKDALESKFSNPFSGKIFRIYKDVRFSKDKTPYNTHIRMAWWSDHEERVRPGFYLSLEANKISVGAGRFEFEKEALGMYRNAVADDHLGDQLVQIITNYHKTGIRIMEPDLKKVPAGFDPQSPRAELLKYKGIHFWLDTLNKEIVLGELGPEKVVTEFAKFKDFYEWLIHIPGK